MEIGSNNWDNLIVTGASLVGVTVTAPMLRGFAEHARSLLVWNRKTNLTAITDPEAMAVKHFVDALAPAGLIRTGANVLDVGAGGGFPGIPIKVVREDLAMTLVDAVRKKVSFIQHVIRSLGLAKTTARHIRAQDLARQPDASGCFDVVICRALTDLAAFFELARPLVAPGGIAIAMKGRLSAEELERAQTAVRHCLDKTGTGWQPMRVEARQYRLPVFNAERALVRFA